MVFTKTLVYIQSQYACCTHIINSTLCMAWHVAYMHVDLVSHVHYRDDDIEMGSNAAYGTVESQYEDISVPDKPRDEPIYV